MNKFLLSVVAFLSIPTVVLANPVVSSTKGTAYNVIEVNEEKFTLEVPVAGYNKSSITVSAKGNVLMVTGLSSNVNRKVLYKGFNPKDFMYVFSLKKNTVISRLSMDSGILFIELTLLLPEDQRTKKFIIE